MRRLALSLLLALAASCGPPEPDPDTFEDHTVPEFETTEDWFGSARDGGSTQAVKFVITNFTNAGRQVRYYDSNFFQLHDEWYWFRLMNQVRVPGDELTQPFNAGQAFESIADIVAWANDEADLPLDLLFVGERLYSPRFYQLALASDPRAFGVGTLIHAPARQVGEERRDEAWAFELEYQDNVAHSELVVFFNELTQTLPSEIADNVRWLVRSPQQEALAVQMEQAQLQFHDRIMRYSELAIAGETEVYSEGLVAGRLRLVTPGGETLEDSNASDVLVLADVPDYLPPCAALLTGVPQTPLAHINVLARNRGIPNAYVGGINEDPNLDQLARVRAPVVVLAEGQAPGRVVIQPITEAQFAQYRSLTRTAEVAVPAIDLANAPYTLDLAALSLDEVETLRPLIGGKSAGTLALLAGEVTMPDFPMSVTARAYAEHIAPLVDVLTVLTEDIDVRRDSRIRTLVLEGPESFSSRFPTASDAAFADAFMGNGSQLAQLASEGGVQGRILDEPIDPAALTVLEDALRDQFASFAPEQGLRFRSSSSVEDIEGFNGAGLYTSNTGYLDPELAGKSADKHFARAMKQTWMSYWGTEAYDERELSGVAHLSGNMAVLVHARFDDDKELSNAVFTYTILPSGEREMIVNIQDGALSVTNPPPGVNALPEIDRVTEADGELVIERVAGSTELPEGEQILDDGELQQVFTEAGRVTDAWLAQENTGLLSAQRRRTLTLDLELREMDLYWPLLENGNTHPRRLIIKQARSLEPSLGNVPPELLAQPLRRDILARARSVERRDCLADSFTLTTIEVTTDRLKIPDMGHALDPFTGFVTLELTREVPELGFGDGERFTVTHPAFASQSHPGLPEGGPWNLDLVIDPERPEADRFTALSLTTDGQWRIARDEVEVSGTWSGCQIELLFSTPEELLRSFIGE